MFIVCNLLDHIHQGQHKNDNFNEQEHSCRREKRIEIWGSAEYNHTYRLI